MERASPERMVHIVTGKTKSGRYSRTKRADAKRMAEVMEIIDETNDNDDDTYAGSSIIVEDGVPTVLPQTDFVDSANTDFIGLTIIPEHRTDDGEHELPRVDSILYDSGLTEAISKDPYLTRFPQRSSTPTGRQSSKFSYSQPRAPVHVQPLMHALEIPSVNVLNKMLESPNNVAIFFTKKGCPHCKAFKPVWDDIARNIHSSNMKPQSVPIIIAKIDGYKFKDELEQLRPGWNNNRAYPTILFKKPNFDNGSIETVEWDRKVERSKENLLDFMALFYDDPTLVTYTPPIETLMNNPNPEFIFLYSSAFPMVDRFRDCISDLPMMDVISGNTMIQSAFMQYPEIARRGMAIAVNDADRADFPVPAIIDMRSDREFRYRDAQRWMQAEIAKANSARVSHTPRMTSSSTNAQQQDIVSDGGVVGGFGLDFTDNDAGYDGDISPMTSAENGVPLDMIRDNYVAHHQRDQASELSTTMAAAFSNRRAAKRKANRNGFGQRAKPNTIRV